MKNKEKAKAYLLLFISLIIYSLVSIISKVASNNDFLSLKYFFYIGLEFFFLAIYAVLWQMVLKRIPLFVAYANKGITIFFGLLFGYFIFHENVTLFNIIGTTIIFVGIIIMMFEDEKNE